MPFDLGFQEMIVVLIVSILVFGGRLPDVARKVGRGISEFRRGMREEFRRVDEAARDDGPPEGWQPPPDGEDCAGLGDKPAAPEASEREAAPEKKP